MEVELSIGTYRVEQPTLDGWCVVAESLREEDYTAIAAGISYALGVDRTTWTAANADTARAALGLAQVSMGMVRRSPALLKALMQACLRHPSMPETYVHAGQATAEDAGVFLAEIIRARLLQQVWESLKNSLAPVLGLTEPEQATQRQPTERSPV